MGHLEFFPVLTKYPSFPLPNPSGFPLLLPSSYLLLESFLLCFLFHALLFSHQLLSQVVGFLEKERQVTGKEREREQESQGEASRMEGP